MLLLLGFFLTTALAFSQSITTYTLIETSRRFDVAGNLKSESWFLFAVNRDGSIVSVDLDPSVAGTRQILDFQRGQTMVVDPKAKAVSMFSYHLQRSGEPCEKRFFYYGDAAVSIDPAAEKMEGVSVRRVSVDWQNGRHMDVFMAPSLGCQMLKSVQQQGGRLIEIMVASHLQIGDPDPALFEIPQGFRRTKYR